MVGLVMALFLCFMAYSQNTENQIDSIPKSWKFSGYVEGYYSARLPKNESFGMPLFIYSHSSFYVPQINLALLAFSMNKNWFRTNIGLMAGTYPIDNLITEPSYLRNLYEFNAGIRLFADKELWLDAGVFSSHIGFESVIGKDCPTLTRGILADNSPYYESGLKVSYASPNGKWNIKGLLLNGWQRMELRKDSKIPAFGHQLEFKAYSGWLFNSSSFLGSVYPDADFRMRYFHNFYAIKKGKNGFQFIFGFDNGWQQMAKSSHRYLFWFTPNFIVRKEFTPKWAAAFRAEYYHDADGMVISKVSPNGFQTMGFSWNADFKVKSYLLARMEYRRLISRDPIFNFYSGSSQIFNRLTISLTAWF